MDDREEFGVGRLKRVDSLEVIWPDGGYQLLTALAVDRLMVVRQSDANEKRIKTAPPDPATRIFQPVDSRREIKYTDPAVRPMDYSVQALLPYVISSHGPVMAAGDVNGDGLDDVFIGGGAGVSGKLFMQRKDGSFVESTAGQPWETDKAYEDWGALFFDANGDGLPDLYVASGGYQLAPTSQLLQDRLYINKGRGKFAKDDHALPPMLMSTATVRAGDFNGDGRPDLFVGGRLSPRNYPAPTRSYILRNDGGHFTDVTEEVAPELIHPGGMITDAVWIDFDGDGRLDLVTVGEWMPIQFYHNDGNRLRNVTRSTSLPPLNGWWYSLAAGDFDHDGRPDLVAGNLGLNYTYTTSKESPFGIYAADLTGSRNTDIVLAETIDGKEYPYNGFAPMGQAIYTMGIRYPTYGSFAQASVDELLTPSQKQNAIHYQADTFASLYLRNDGGGKFSASPLPNLAQIAPIRGIIARDVDGDGNLDLIVAGNLYDAEPNTPRADAGNGLWLKGNGRGRFTPVPPSESGLLTPKNVAGLASINTPAGMAIVVANTGDSLQAFNIRKR